MAVDTAQSARVRHQGTPCMHRRPTRHFTGHRWMHPGGMHMAFSGGRGGRGTHRLAPSPGTMHDCRDVRSSARLQPPNHTSGAWDSRMACDTQHALQPPSNSKRQRSLHRLRLRRRGIHPLLELVLLERDRVHVALARAARLEPALDVRERPVRERLGAAGLPPVNQQLQPGVGRGADSRRAPRRA